MKSPYFKSLFDLIAESLLVFMQSAVEKLVCVCVAGSGCL